jgi:UDP-N-acetylmuramyl pentapeptide phosphotransferase/UDP-N-acetylglucosamine-1-phosphate transferase
LKLGLSLEAKFGFHWFNAYPAEIFFGEAGSLFPKARLFGETL